MATYASSGDLEEYIAGNDDVVLPVDVEALLEQAERDVDLAIGQNIAKLPSGLLLDPALLSASQREALARATCAAAEWRLLIDADDLTGGLSVIPSTVTLIGRPGRPPGPRVLEELAGHALIRRSGTVKPDPPPLAA